MTDMTATEVAGLLREEVTRTGSASAWARANGVSPAYVSDVLSGYRKPAGRILEGLGIQRVVTYRRVK